MAHKSLGTSWVLSLISLNTVFTSLILRSSRCKWRLPVHDEKGRAIWAQFLIPSLDRLAIVYGSLPHLACARSQSAALWCAHQAWRSSDTRNSIDALHCNRKEHRIDFRHSLCGFHRANTESSSLEEKIDRHYHCRYADQNVDPTARNHDYPLRNSPPCSLQLARSTYAFNCVPGNGLHHSLRCIR